MNNEMQKFDFKGASLRTLTDEAGSLGSSPRTYATSSNSPIRRLHCSPSTMMKKQT
ncbi:MAG: hypothetical protein ACLUAT_00855 [Bifidobacterium bifidum]